MRGKRGLSSEDARKVRRRGHDDALEFALSIGLDSDYQNDKHAKKDVIDPSGDAHSVKSGVKKWQVFLYSLGRFKSDYAFGVMNGIGELLIHCINSFPKSFEDYKKDKREAKEKLRPRMVALAEKLQKPARLRAFLSKSMFNGGEVDYLTVKHDDKFHIFHYLDVVETFSDFVEVTNSVARTKNQVSDQKVIFKYKDRNLAELEMRNDSPIHYREVRFNMLKPRVMDLLLKEVPFKRKYSDKVFVYGRAAKKFGRWRKRK